MGKEIQELSFVYLNFEMTVKMFPSREIWVGDVN